MGRVIYVASPHRIVVSRRDLLPHHLFVLNLLWVGAFLPHLVVSILPVGNLALCQLPEHVLSVFLLEMIDDLAVGEGFEVADLFTDIDVTF